MDQQQQTRSFFERAAADWQRTAESDAFTIIAGRNKTVLDVAGKLPRVADFLDVGCGTGQLVIDMARRGVHAVGVDFAADMIAQCEQNRGQTVVEAEFITASFFELPVTADRYDLISALGFIEYVAPEQTDEFLRRSFRMLRPGGAVVVGSRNRLFNVVSLNEFTQIEIELSLIERFVAQAMALRLSANQAEGLEALRPFEGVDPQPRSHPKTGVDVTVRYQFTPGDLVARARACGFVPQTLYPVHYHGIPVVFGEEQKRLHAELTAIIDREAPADQRLLPYCSTFVLDARKPQ
jgi:2-polyprenyl-3-methyl-5-hydroxy-6-metoxy-1,4-benzoquinol methylase